MDISLKSAEQREDTGDENPERGLLGYWGTSSVM